MPRIVDCKAELTREYQLTELAIIPQAKSSYTFFKGSTVSSNFLFKVYMSAKGYTEITSSLPKKGLMSAVAFAIPIDNACEHTA